jgi:hypothetical protein
VTKNIGDADRTARLLVGATTSFLFFHHVVDGAARIVLGVVSLLLLASALLGWSLLYAILRVSTRKANDAPNVDS